MGFAWFLTHVLNLCCKCQIVFLSHISRCSCWGKVVLCFKSSSMASLCLWCAAVCNYAHFSAKWNLKKNLPSSMYAFYYLSNLKRRFQKIPKSCQKSIPDVTVSPKSGPIVDNLLWVTNSVLDNKDWQVELISGLSSYLSELSAYPEQADLTNWSISFVLRLLCLHWQWMKNTIKDLEKCVHQMHFKLPYKV